LNSISLYGLVTTKSVAEDYCRVVPSNNLVFLLHNPDTPTPTL